MKHARGLKTLCQHLRVFSCLKIILHWKTMPQRDKLFW
ncbi:hypothetical protein Godav_025156 [Gossypium davidsonii]|uniref:Uncharacterized protein n=2 Tax=Gossypium TaxID=3633 RepID=A0A7J8TBD7_GOSDV|nr:hypothetical protein [Gossypium davidsonii]MBA0669546.1 hypothetical protein [Gossypium klotzschianum]